LSYKEYELTAIFEIIYGGSGYKVDDVIYLRGGFTSRDTYTGNISIATLKINKVKSNGAIEEIGIVSKGKYTQIPPKECFLDGGNGTNAKIQVDYKLLENRKMVERTVVLIDSDHLCADLHINHPLPEGVTEGKISLEKHELLLTGDYQGEDAKDVNYQIVRDFTPNIRLPLASKGSFNPELVYKKAFLVLDSKIQDLENRIKELEKSKII
jgi:hypothetical protein